MLPLSNANTKPNTKMNLTPNLFEVAAQLNAAIKKAEREILIAGGSAYFCGPDGSLMDDEIDALVDAGETVELVMDIERYRENARTLNDKGRRELAAEENAKESIVALAAKLMGKDIEVTGDGSGSAGPITIYTIGKL